MNVFSHVHLSMASTRFDTSTSLPVGSGAFARRVAILEVRNKMQLIGFYGLFYCDHFFEMFQDKTNYGIFVYKYFFLFSTAH